MTTHVILSESVVLKRFSTADAASAAFDRAEALRSAGFATPRPTRADDQTLRFPRIRGTTGPDLIASLPDLLAPLLALQQVHLPALRLPRHDALLRIRPRLCHAPAAISWLAQQQLCHLPAERDTICHGDFHPGQVIRDASGRSWLLDLDDLARGPVEADLGNLMAWLATRPLPSPQPLLHRIAQERETLLAAWSGMGGCADRDLLEPYITLALIRRALKAAERGDPTLLTEMSANI